jgi:hypothetical protein
MAGGEVRAGGAGRWWWAAAAVATVSALCLVATTWVPVQTASAGLCPDTPCTIPEPPTPAALQVLLGTAILGAATTVLLLAVATVVATRADLRARLAGSSAAGGRPVAVVLLVAGILAAVVGLALTWVAGPGLGGALRFQAFWGVDLVLDPSAAPFDELRFSLLAWTGLLGQLAMDLGVVLVVLGLGSAVALRLGSRRRPDEPDAVVPAGPRATSA